MIRRLKQRTVVTVLMALLGSLCIVVAPALAGSAAAAVSADRVLVFGNRDNGTEGNSAAATLASLGLTVDRLPDLPADLTPYTSIWYVEAYKGLTDGEIDQLTAFVKAGGGLYLTGERPCCEGINTSVQQILRGTLLDQDVQVGGIGDVGGPFTFNTGVTDHVSDYPNQLVDFVPDSPGGLTGMGGVNAANVLAGSSSVPVAGIWAEKHMKSGKGRIAVVMDIDWLTQDTRAPILENLANFLQHGTLCTGTQAGFTWTGLASCTTVLAPSQVSWTVTGADEPPSVTIDQNGVTQECYVVSDGNTMTVTCDLTAVSGRGATVVVTARVGDATSTRSVRVAYKNDPRNVPAPFALSSDWWNWPDADGDGLPDKWERDGVWVDGRFADLSAMGADPDHKDLFLRIDYEAGQEPRGLTEALLKEHFADSPLTNPDGSTGVRLHVNVASSIPSSVIGDFSLALGPLVKAATYSGFGSDPMSGGIGVPQLSKWLVNIEGGRKDRGYLCGGTPSSGCAYVGGGSGFTAADVDGASAALGVDLPVWDADARSLARDQVLSVVMAHELGHELGLKHHGAEADPNDDPKYKSVMSYAYSFFGLPNGGILGGKHSDYSRESKVNLDWKMGSKLGSLSFVRGQFGDDPGFYVRSAGNAKFEVGEEPTELTVAQAVRAADPAAVQEFIDQYGVPAAFNPPTVRDASASTTSGATIDVPLVTSNPAGGSIQYVIDDQSPLGTAVPSATGLRFTAGPDAGTATLAVRARGERFGSSQATVTITVKAATPAAPAKPTSPSGPSSPGGPSTPADPVSPAAPAAPAAPAGPVSPGAPSVPESPAGPVTPDAPAKPATVAAVASTGQIRKGKELTVRTTAAAGDLLVATVAGPTTGMSTPTVKSLRATGLTWNRVGSRTAAGGTIEIWQAKAPARFSGSVTATLKSAGTDRSLVVTSFSGAGSTVKLLTAATGRASVPGVTAKPSAAGSLILAVGVGTNSPRTLRAAGGQAIVQVSERHGAASRRWVQKRGSATTSDEPVKLGLTGAAWKSWQLVAFEVSPAG